MNDLETIRQSVYQRTSAYNAKVKNARIAADQVSSKMRLLRYGGAALHALLPNSTIYEEDHTFDIDAFTCKGNTSKKTAYAAASLMGKQGVTGTRVIPAMHKSTYSVRMGRDVILDVHWISPNDHRVLERLAKEEKLISHNVAPTAFLKMSMHLELSRPAVYIERWEKVWKRLDTLYSSFPNVQPHPVGKGKEVEELPLGEIPDIRQALRDFGCVLVGKDAVRAITGNSELMKAWPVDVVLPSWPGDKSVKNPSVMIESLKLTHMVESTGKATNKGLFGPPYYTLTDTDGKYVARIHVIDTEVCTTESPDGLVYGSMDLVLHLLYSEYVRTTPKNDTNREELVRAIDSVVMHPNGESWAKKRFAPFNYRHGEPDMNEEIDDHRPLDEGDEEEPDKSS